MRIQFNKNLLAALIAGMLLPIAAQAAEADLQKKVDALAQEIEQLKSQVKKTEDKSLGKWLTVGGDYHFRYDVLEGQTKTFTDVNATLGKAAQALQGDFFANPSTVAGSSHYFGAPQAGGMSTAGALSALMAFQPAMNSVGTFDQARAFLGNPMNGGLVQGIGGFAATVPAYKPENSSLMSNRLGLDINAKATQDVSVTAHFQMYKVFGAQNEAAITNSGSAPFFADRVGVFDGTLSRVPSNSYLNVDRVYATWSNIADQEMWFSVGRRPSTSGAPSNLKNNNPRPGNGGIPSLLVDYAFDGVTLGYAPEIDALPGAYGKLCYGRGFDSGYSNPTNSLKDTDMVGLALVPIDTDPLRVWMQWNRGMNIFDAPTMNNTYFGNTGAKTNLGEIDWYGVGFMSTFKNMGPGNLHVFGDMGMSVTHPNDNVSAQFGFQGLMTGSFFNPEAPTSKTGTAVALGLRYDLPSRTMFGLEYNHGSKDWITFAPAADDMWTSKVGVRGDVVEAYVIQELDRMPISSYFSKAFFRMGVQRYDIKYTGSNNWVGAPVEMSAVNGQMMTMTPLETATNVYATFEVKF